MDSFVAVLPLAALPSGSSRAVEFNGRTVALFHTPEGLFAVDDTCTHAGGPLSEGVVEEGCAVCPWHGATFHLASGAGRNRIAEQPVRCYDVRTRGDTIEIAPRD